MTADTKLISFIYGHASWKLVSNGDVTCCENLIKSKFFAGTVFSLDSLRRHRLFF